MRPIHPVAIAFVMFACSASVDGLDLGQKIPPELCESTEENNLLEMTRFGMLLSDQIVEGRFAAATGSGNDIKAELEIQKVHTGASFLTGMRVQVAFDANEVRRLGLPGDFIVGFGDNLYPLRDDDGSIFWWSKHAIAPVNARASLADAINYRADRSPWIAVIEIVERNEDRARFRVIEAIAGDLPEEVWVNWGVRSSAAPFPDPSPERYVASFNYLSRSESENLYLGSAIDFRPATPDNLRVIRGAVAAGSTPPYDAAALRDFAAGYRTGWRMHRSPHVVAANALGFAEECCTNAGGTYVNYSIETHLRGSSTQPRLLRGGHGYRAEESCGDRRLFGVAALDTFDLPSSSEFSCANNANFPEFRPTHEIRVNLDDTAENRERVTDWLSSREPHYLFHSQAPRPTLGPIALWSTPVSVERALIAGRAAVIRIEDVEQLDSKSSRVRVETTFTEYGYDHLARHHVELYFECGDPRLLEKGAEYLGWIVWDGSEVVFSETELALAAGPFLIPGLLLPNESWVLRTASKLGYAVGR